MLKWCNSAVRGNQLKVLPVVVQCKESQLEEHSYRTLDPSSCKGVSIIARGSLPQQKIEQTSLDTNRQICYLDDPQAILVMQEIRHENRQYKAWVKYIEIVLENMQKLESKKISDYENEWNDSIESILKKLNIENAGLEEERKKMAEEIQSLEKLLEVSEESIEGHSLSRSTETIAPEESDAVFMQVNKQVTKSRKENETYKKWMSSLKEKLKSNLTLNFIKTYKTPNLKMIEDLKAPSFKNVELKQENRKNEETIKSLKVQITENIEIDTIEKKNDGDSFSFFKWEYVQQNNHTLYLP